MSSFRGSLFLSDASEMLALSNILPNKTLLDNFVVKRANVYTCHWLHFGSNSINTVALKKKHPGAWLGYFDKRSPYSDMPGQAGSTLPTHSQFELFSSKRYPSVYEIAWCIASLRSIPDRFPYVDPEAWLAYVSTIGIQAQRDFPSCQPQKNCVRRTPVRSVKLPCQNIEFCGIALFLCGS